MTVKGKVIEIPNTVYTILEVELMDGTLVRLRPLPIAKLRKFMDAWNSRSKGIQEELQRAAEAAQNAEAGADIEGVKPDSLWDMWIACCGIALEPQLSSQVEGKTLRANGELTKEYKDYLEENLDTETIMKVFEVCGGLQLNPKDQENLTGLGGTTLI